jgi:hypothetical protein
MQRTTGFETRAPLASIKGHIPSLTMSADPRLSRQPQVPPPPPPPPMGMDGSNDAHAESNMVADDAFKLKFCTVCASNQNRYVLHRLTIQLD